MNCHHEYWLWAFIASEMMGLFRFMNRHSVLFLLYASIAMVAIGLIKLFKGEKK